MSITSHQAFKNELKNMLKRRVKQFPLYFFGNVAINLSLAAAFAFAAIFAAIGGPIVYMLAFMVFLIGIFPITLRGLRRNIHIYHALRAKHDILDLDEFEMDHAIDFINGLPKSKDEVERMRVALSFGKLIEMFELLDIIHCQNNIYNLDPLLRLKKVAAIASEEEAKKLKQKKNN